MTQPPPDLEQVKGAVRLDLDKKWREAKWTTFIVEAALFLLGKGKDVEDVSETIKALIISGYITEEELYKVSNDKTEFRHELERKGIQAAIANHLFEKFVGGIDPRCRAVFRSMSEEISSLLAEAPLDMSELMQLQHELSPGHPLLCDGPTAREREEIKKRMPARILQNYSRSSHQEPSSPDFLMHGLDKKEFRTCKEVEVFLKKKVLKNPCALYGTSGAGKTRSIFEILARRFGLFFLSSVGSSNAGAGDFHGLWDSIKVKPVFTGNVQPDKFSDDELDRFDENQRVYTRELTLLVASRLLIFHHTSDIFKQSGQNLRPIDWLYCQLYPELFYGGDVFRNGLKSLKAAVLHVGIDPEYVLKALQKLIQKRMYCFVDEAQVLVEERKSGFFISSDAISPRTLYSATVKGLSAIAEDEAICQPVFSGTGLTVQAIKAEVTSSIGKPGTISSYIFHEFKRLDIEGVKTYMSKFVNLAAFHPDLVTHVAKWLVGRPRWTAFFMGVWFRREEPLKVPPDGVFYNDLGLSVDGVTTRMHDNVNLQLELQRYIDLMTSLRVVTSTHASLSIGNTSRAAYALENMDKRYRENRNDYPLLGKFLDATASYLYKGNDFVLEVDDSNPEGKLIPALINCGVCCVDLTRETIMFNNKPKEVFNAVLCEPIIVEAAFQYFMKHDKFREKLFDKIEQNNSVAPTFETVSLITLYSQMNDQIESSLTGIQQGDASTSNFVGALKPFKTCSTAYGVLIQKTSKVEDTLDYLEMSIRTPFPASVPPVCEPDTTIGPDGILFLRHRDEIREFRVVLFQMKFNDSPVSQRKVDETIAPELMYRKKVKEGDTGQPLDRPYLSGLKDKVRWRWLASKLFHVPLPQSYSNRVTTPSRWTKPVSFDRGIDQGQDLEWDQRGAPVIKIAVQYRTEDRDPIVQRLENYCFPESTTTKDLYIRFGTRGIETLFGKSGSEKLQAHIEWRGDKKKGVN